MGLPVSFQIIWRPLFHAIWRMMRGTKEAEQLPIGLDLRGQRIEVSTRNPAVSEHGFSLPPNRPEGGIVGIPDIAQGRIKGLGIRHVELCTQGKPAGEIGVGYKGPPKCDGICVSACKDLLRGLLGKAVIRNENTLE